MIPWEEDGIMCATTKGVIIRQHPRYLSTAYILLTGNKVLVFLSGIPMEKELTCCAGGSWNGARQRVETAMGGVQLWAPVASFRLTAWAVAGGPISRDPEFCQIGMEVQLLALSPLIPSHP